MGWFSSDSSSDDVKSVLEPNGNTSTYFGGEGRADGPGHGHIVCDSDGNVTYARESDSNGGGHGLE
jgi:hypothetical protein